MTHPSLVRLSTAVGAVALVLFLTGGCSSQDTRRRLDALRAQIEALDQEIAELGEQIDIQQATGDVTNSSDDRQLAWESRDELKKK